MKKQQLREYYIERLVNVGLFDWDYLNTRPIPTLKKLYAKHFKESRQVVAPSVQGKDFPREYLSRIYPDYKKQFEDMSDEEIEQLYNPI